MSAIPSEVAQSYGDLPNSWRLEKLKFSARVRNSNVDKKTEDGEEPVRLCNYTDVYYNDRITPDMDFMEATATESEIERFTLKQGQVIITKDSEGWDDIGIPAYVTEDMPGVLCGYHLSVLEPDGENLDGAFLSWLCRADPLNDQFKLGSNGVTRYGLGQYPLKSSYIPLPDLDTQRRIAGYLDNKTARIDALIEKKRALLDRLAEKRQALITRAVTRGLNPDAPLKDSGIDWLGKVPAHWTVKKLRRVKSYLTSGSRDWAAFYADEGEPFIRMTNVTKQGVELDLSDLRFVKLDGETEGTRTAIKAGDILITITAELGSVAVARDNVEGAYINQHLALFRADKDLCNPDFLVNFLSTDMARAQFFENGQGGTKQGLGFEQVNNVWAAFPPLEEQEEIGVHCAEIWRKYGDVQRPLEGSLQKLTEYRAALATAAVTGKIKALLTEDAPKPAKKEAPAAFKRSVLAAYIADTLCDHPTFGRVKFQKLLHLCEAHLEIQEVAGNYHRDAAGPFDTQMMRSVHSQIEKQGWIAPMKGDKGWTYARGEKVDGYRDHFDRYFGDRKEALEDLLALIAPMKTQQAEIVSTAFAAWNDLLLEGKTPSDDDIVDLILNDWTESKKAISADRWHSALAWMREKGLTPRGLGEHTKRKS